MADPIAVIIVDDHAQVRLALGIALTTFDDIKVVGEAENGKQAFALCKTLRLQVVLMDLIMPETNGVMATEMIHEAFPQIRIIVLTSSVDVDLLDAALEAGANQYLLKNVSVHELAATIRQVSEQTT